MVSPIGMNNDSLIDAARVRAGEAQVAQVGKLKGGARNAQQIDQVAEDFEAVFLSQMMEHMFAGVETDAVFGGGPAEGVYRSFMLDEYGKLISRAGGVGVADYVKRELIKLQETER